jgi:hypothetical protein
MAKKAGEIAPFKILARIHFNLQVAVCPPKIWSVLHTYHNYINPNNNPVQIWQELIPHYFPADHFEGSSYLAGTTTKKLTIVLYTKYVRNTKN